MDGLKPPNGLSFEGNLAANWKKWKQSFEIYMIATGAISKQDETKIAILLHVIGEDALEKFNTFDLNDEDRKTYSKVLEAFEKHCLPLSNESVDRHIFFSRVQQPGEMFDDFLTQLKKLSITCGFGALRDSLIKDRIISGIADKTIKDRLLREGQLNLDKCVKICKASELAEIQLKTLNDENKVDAVKFKKNWKSKEKGLSTGV